MIETYDHTLWRNIWYIKKGCSVQWHIVATENGRKYVTWPPEVNQVRKACRPAASVKVHVAIWYHKYLGTKGVPTWGL